MYLLRSTSFSNLEPAGIVISGKKCLICSATSYLIFARMYGQEEHPAEVDIYLCRPVFMILALLRYRLTE